MRLGSRKKEDCVTLRARKPVLRPSVVRTQQQQLDSWNDINHSNNNGVLLLVHGFVLQSPVSVRRDVATRISKNKGSRHGPTCSTPVTATTHHYNGRFFSAIRLEMSVDDEGDTTTTNDDDDDKPQSPNVEASLPPPPSQAESVVINAKSVTAESFRDTTVDDDNKNKLSVWLRSSAAGLAVSLAMVPKAVAFSFVAGVSPLVGLWTTVVLGFVAAILGGRAGICSSASGACSVVVAALCASHGPGYVSTCAILAGALQVLAGCLGLGKFIRLVPHPVMLGFVNGLAIVMTRAQLVHFRSSSANGGGFLSLLTAQGASMYGVTALTMVLVKLWPKVSQKVRALASIPSTLAAVVLSTVVAKGLQLPVRTLADIAGAETFGGGWAVVPRLAWPTGVPPTWSTLQIVLPYAMTMAAVGCIESLLTMQLLDGMVDDGQRGSTRQECIGQGCGNVLAGFTGGIGGCALLGQSIINVQSGGGGSKWSGMSMALFLATGIVIAAPLLGAVPVASLVGVMLLVCHSTFSWSSLRLLRKIPKLDAAVIALVSIATVQKDLAYAVVLGTMASALGFAWKQSTTLTASSSSFVVQDNKDDKTGTTKKLYQLNGPVFFGSTTQFTSLFDPKTDPEEVIVDFTNSRVMDHSALEAIQTVADQYGALGKTIRLRRLSKDCVQLLQRLDRRRGDDNNQPNSRSSNDTTTSRLPPYEVIESDPTHDPVYQVAESSERYRYIKV